MIVVAGTGSQGASIPIRGVYLHGVEDSLACLEALLLDRQLESEAAAATKDALDPDPSAVQLDEAPPEREPEARALTLLDADARLLELLEDPLVVDSGGSDDDAPALGGELDGIREQVEDHVA